MLSDAEAEEDLQRRELQRLLSTAKDEDRRLMITKAINALDITEQAYKIEDEQSSSSSKDKFFQTLHPSIHSSIFESEAIPTIEKANNSSFKRRPLSAVKGRRPSISASLDVIPERVVSLRNKSPPERHTSRERRKKDDERPTSSGSIGSAGSRDSDSGDSAYLYYEDILDVVASSCDHRYPPKGVFKRNSPTHPSSSSSSLSGYNSNGYNSTGYNSATHSATSSRHASPLASSSPTQAHPILTLKMPRMNNSWSGTGLVPQFFKVQFVEKWIITKIEVRCAGIQSLSALIHTSAVSPLSAAKVLHMTRTADNNFSVDLSNAQFYSNLIGGMGGIGGKGNSISGNGKDEHPLGVTGCGVTFSIQLPYNSSQTDVSNSYGSYNNNNNNNNNNDKSSSRSSSSSSGSGISSSSSGSRSSSSSSSGSSSSSDSSGSNGSTSYGNSSSRTGYTAGVGFENVSHPHSSPYRPLSSQFVTIHELRIKVLPHT